MYRVKEDGLQIAKEWRCDRPACPVDGGRAYESICDCAVILLHPENRPPETRGGKSQCDVCRIALGALPVQRLKACVNALTSR